MITTRTVWFHEERDEDQPFDNRSTDKYNLRTCVAGNITTCGPGFIYQVQIIKKYWECSVGALHTLDCQRLITNWTIPIYNTISSDEVSDLPSFMNHSLVSAMANGLLSDSVFQSLCFDLFTHFLKTNTELQEMLNQHVPKYYTWLMGWINE